MLHPFCCSTYRYRAFNARIAIPYFNTQITVPAGEKEESKFFLSSTGSLIIGLRGNLIANSTAFRCWNMMRNWGSVLVSLFMFRIEPEKERILTEWLRRPGK